MISPMEAPKGRDFSHLSRGLSILVEEEESIRRSWSLFFSKQGLRLLVFDSAENFLAEFHPQGEPVEFFFDQDFGNQRGVGLRLATIVRNWPGRTGTSLVTNYDPEDFEVEISGGTLDAVLPKFPDSIFGEGFYVQHMERRFREQGQLAVLIESVSRVSNAFRSLKKINKGQGVDL